MILSDTVRHDIFLVCSKIQYDDSDIKSIQYNSGISKLCIFNFPMSMFFESIIGETVKELNVVLNRTSRISRPVNLLQP